MARKLTAEQLFNELMLRHEPKLARAFIDAVNDLRATASLQRLSAALAAGDIEAALEALNLDDAVFDDLLEAIRDAFQDSGRETTTNMPSHVGSVRFGGRNPRAEAWLSSYSSQLVRRIMDEQRAALREHLAEGLARGAAPRSLTTSIVGRVNRVTGKREGGVLGLTQPQAAYVRSARLELESGDPALLRAYLQRGRRDKRFDRTITRIIREGGSVPKETIDKAIIAYERRLLDLRATTVARTETMTALHEAQQEAVLQAIDNGAVTEAQVRRVWRSAGDLRVRHTHRGLNGDTVGLRESFVSPSGATLRFPGDPQAPTAERVNCRCWLEVRFTVNPNLR